MMSENKFKFTDARLRKLEHDGSKKRLYFYDILHSGLTLQITPAGTKTFQFRRWDKSRKRTANVILGRYGALSLNQARKQSAELLVQLNNGIDIVNDAQSLANEPTLNDLFEKWLEHHAKPHKKTWDEDQRRYNLYCKKPLGNKQLSWFTTDRIRKWHHDITKTVKSRGGKVRSQDSTGNKEEIKNYISPTTANRALALLSTIFNQLDHNNPCKGVKKFKEISRDRFLEKHELRRFFNALNAPETHQDLRDYLLLSLLTGARRSNVLAMKWSDISTEQRMWIIPANESKNGEAMPVPLLPLVQEILERRKKTAASIFVLPGKGKTGHYVEPKKGWKSLIKRAGIKDTWLHDLRRTMGSYLTMTGANLPIISKTLGHKSQATTAIYARSDYDPVREGMKSAFKLMEEHINIPENVVPIKK